jgi:hypothetical protein
MGAIVSAAGGGIVGAGGDGGVQGSRFTGKDGWGVGRGQHLMERKTKRFVLIAASALIVITAVLIIVGIVSRNAAPEMVTASRLQYVFDRLPSVLESRVMVVRKDSTFLSPKSFCDLAGFVRFSPQDVAHIKRSYTWGSPRFLPTSPLPTSSPEGTVGPGDWEQSEDFETFVMNESDNWLEIYLKKGSCWAYVVGVSHY